MAQTATVNYHVHKPERQAFELDAGGIIGNLISPDLAVTQVSVSDTRQPSTPALFDVDSVGFTATPTKVHSFDTDQNWESTYNAELTTLLQDQVAAKDVIIFDHTVRTDDPNAGRKPARNVHSDYSLKGPKSVWSIF